MSHPVALALRLVLLTGCRPSEVAGMTTVELEICVVKVGARAGSGR